MENMNIKKLMILALLPSLAFVAQNIAMDPQQNQPMHSTPAAQQALMARLMAADKERKQAEEDEDPLARAAAILTDVAREGQRQFPLTRPGAKATERLRRPS
ncbi:hypothetical protein JST99_03255 [Candidatus Dependentiae bacterium]|nr:hypothetical protein [Candidatus Dependentiae bacterium]